MTSSLTTPIEQQFRTIDGMTIGLADNHVIRIVGTRRAASERGVVEIPEAFPAVVLDLRTAR